MDSKDLINRLIALGLPVFSLETIGSIMQKPIGYTRLYANRLCKRGIIDKVENGMYCLPGTDEYTIASRIIPYSYITSYAALDYYGLTSQTTTELQVVSFKYHRHMKLANYKVRFTRVKRDFVYGYSPIFNGPVFAEPEKIFVDDIYLHRKQYYSEEFESAIRRGKLNINRFKEYAMRSGDNAVIRMAGHYLEAYGIASDNMPESGLRASLRISNSGKPGGK
ncbi:hypothetical protein B2A_10135 [mine drainage metagenome]|uniref:Transcriptional regulator n=1 Tax=mine drainage metagenome TaxID=410659 RepID=T0Z4G5_9ZZZZ